MIVLWPLTPAYSRAPHTGSTGIHSTLLHSFDLLDIVVVELIMEAAAKSFFSSTYFAVAGASQSPHKFAYTVLAFYHARGLPVQPITPSRPSISVSSTTYATIPSPLALPYPAETSISIITQPSVTLQVLREAKDAGVSSVWLQPGSFDDEGLEYARREFKAGVGGNGGMGGEGWCVLVDGDRLLQAVRKEKEIGKLS